ncbi:uncharacterized protein LOC141925539 [Strix aluco]|uniref:uncharacterized protein LOC141925539 n=1 Tax=Strix aluco TaxID=111821 RepID=UPI003DA482F4
MVALRGAGRRGETKGRRLRAGAKGRVRRRRVLHGECGHCQGRGGAIGVHAQEAEGGAERRRGRHGGQGLPAGHPLPAAPPALGTGVPEFSLVPPDPHAPPFPPLPGSPLTGHLGTGDGTPLTGWGEGHTPPPLGSPPPGAFWGTGPLGDPRCRGAATGFGGAADGAQHPGEVRLEPAAARPPRHCHTIHFGNPVCCGTVDAVQGLLVADSLPITDGEGPQRYRGPPDSGAAPQHQQRGGGCACASRTFLNPGPSILCGVCDCSPPRQWPPQPPELVVTPLHLLQPGLGEAEGRRQEQLREEGQCMVALVRIWTPPSCPFVLPLLCPCRSCRAHPGTRKRRNLSRLCRASWE